MEVLSRSVRAWWRRAGRTGPQEPPSWTPILPGPPSSGRTLRNHRNNYRTSSSYKFTKCPLCSKSYGATPFIVAKKRKSAAWPSFTFSAGKRELTFRNTIFLTLSRRQVIIMTSKFEKLPRAWFCSDLRQISAKNRTAHTVDWQKEISERKKMNNLKDC